MNFQALFLPVGETLGKKIWAKEKAEDIIGLEFENETLEEFLLPEIPGWNNHEEQSLRNFGFEYVLRSPRSMEKLKKPVGAYFNNLGESLGGIGKLLNSRRTSTHVHFDSTLLTPIEILNISLVYWLIEPLLSEFCGEVRKGNHFCLSAKDTLANIRSLRRGVVEGNIWESIVFSNEYRYASLNLASVYKFGSMEWRLMRGLSEENTLWTWIKILSAIRKYGLSLKNPRELYIKFLREMTAEDFPRIVLGDDLYSELRPSLPLFYPVAEEIREMFVNLTPLMVAHDNWEFKIEIEAEKKRSKTQKKTPNALSWATATNSLSGLIYDDLSPSPPINYIPYPDDPWDQPATNPYVAVTPASEEDDVIVFAFDDHAPYTPSELELNDL